MFRAPTVEQGSSSLGDRVEKVDVSWGLRTRLEGFSTVPATSAQLKARWHETGERREGGRMLERGCVQGWFRSLQSLLWKLMPPVLTHALRKAAMPAHLLLLHNDFLQCSSH